MALANKHVAVLVDEAYQEMEVWYPVYRLREAGVRVTMIGPGTRDVYPSKLGYPCKPDLKIGEARAADYDAVIIPGGWAPDFMRRTQAMIDFVAEMNAAGKLLAPICHGGWLACSADAVRGKRATSFFAIKHDMMHAGALWEDAECVADQNLISARCPDDLPAFMRAILAALEK